MLSLQEQRLVLACLSKVDSRKDVPETVELSASEYSDMMGVDISNAYRELHSSAEKLYEQSILISGDNSTVKFRWVQKQVIYHKGEGRITITWGSEILKYIGQLKNRFTTYKLRHVAHLQSPYSIRLYELLMQWNNTTKERVIYVDAFRKLFKLEDKYPLFKDLNKWVIKPSIAELNKRSDLIIKYETIKKGRRVAALSFEFKKDNQLKMDI